MRSLAKFLCAPLILSCALAQTENSSVPTSTHIDHSIAEICGPQGPVPCLELLAAASEWVQRYAPRGRETAFKNSGAGSWGRVEVKLLHTRADSDFIQERFNIPVIDVPEAGQSVADAFTLAGEDRLRSVRVMHVAFLWDQITGYDIETGHVERNELIFARLLTILAHEFLGNVQIYTQQSNSAYRRWSADEKIDTEIRAYREGIKFLKRVLATENNFENLTTRKDLETTLKRDEAALATWIKARAQKRRCETHATLRLLPPPKTAPAPSKSPSAAKMVARKKSRR